MWQGKKEKKKKKVKMQRKYEPEQCLNTQRKKEINLRYYNNEDLMLSKLLE